MADFDSFDYDIASRLPEWWKGFGALEPINEYTQTLISQILEGLLTTMGVVQPLNCWLTIPEEYTWYHHYKPTDGYLQDEQGEQIITEKAVNTIFPGNKIHVQIPNTKRNCHAKIKLKLLGRELKKSDNNSPLNKKEIIEELIIQNANQIITLKNISTTSTIEIFTESGEILIDDSIRDDLVEGKIEKIKPTIKYANYQEPYIDENEYVPTRIQRINSTEEIELETQHDWYLPLNIKKEHIYQLFTIFENTENQTYIKILDIDNSNQFPIYKAIFCSKQNDGSYIIHDKECNISVVGEPIKDILRYNKINIENENKKTEIILDSSKTVNFDLQVYLYKPTYTTEQNIRITSVSAFPIEWVELYGYFCHPFNNNVGYKYLWRKEYPIETRTTYDRITRQYDCERFYVKVKFHGIGVPLVKGFPQEINSTDKMYQPNPNLDRWGRVYGLPRRNYKTKITEDEEPYTFPKYYTYPIEQDYWYEERIVNEYKFDEDAVNALFVKDDELNNIGMLECIYPFMDDIWVYTETIDPKSNKTNSLELNQKKEDIQIASFSQNLDELGKEWEDPYLLSQKPIYITLNPQSDDIIKLNDQSYKTKPLKCSFDLSPFDDEIPKNITIKGIELQLETETNVQSKTIKLDDSSSFILPYVLPENKEFGRLSDEYILEKINIIHDETIWMKEKGSYTIGGPTNLFQEKEISREQLFKGNDGKIEFELIFTNDNDFLESTLYVKNLVLKIYYEIIENDYSLNVNFNKKEINLQKDEPHVIEMSIDVQNNGKIEVNDKELYIIIPPELKLLNDYNSFKFNLAVNEKFTIDNIYIKPVTFDDGIRTGWYDVLVFCEDKVIANEILIRGAEL